MSQSESRRPLEPDVGQLMTIIVKIGSLQKATIVSDYTDTGIALSRNTFRFTNVRPVGCSANRARFLSIAEFLEKSSPPTKD